MKTVQFVGTFSRAGEESRLLLDIPEDAFDHKLHTILTTYIPEGVLKVLERWSISECHVVDMTFDLRHPDMTLNINELLNTCK